MSDSRTVCLLSSNFSVQRMYLLKFIYRFGKILHSPTDSCLESSESWWCHRHSHGDEDADGGVCKSSSHSDDHRSISPADTCLFNETNIIFIKKHLDSDRHLVVGEKCVVCSRCRNRIGYIADKGDKLNFFKVCIT